MALSAVWQRFSGRRKRLLALSLAAWAAVSCTFPACAAPIGDGVNPLCDEAYYATTDYYGNLTDGSVVKSYQRNGAPSLTDYGAYEQVTNLTDGSAPDWRGNAITFQFGADAPNRFYFEGKTSQPFQNLPWTLSVHYALNGVPARAPDLAGKTGLVEITIDALPNASASAYARNNYILAATAIFNQDDILSLEAPGAQLQLIGNLRTALFLAFPGEEQHFTIRVGSEDFSFDGLTFLMVPATLSQLDEVAKLSEKKNDLEDSYHRLSDSLDTVLDSFSDMRDDLYATANGLETLNQARQTLSDGKGGVYGDLDALRADLEALAAALDPLPQQARAAGAFVTEAKSAVNALIDTALRLRGTLTDGEGVLQALESALSEMEAGLAEVESGLTDTLSALAGVETCLENTGTGLNAVEDGLRDTTEGLMRIEDGLNATSRGLEGVESGLSDTAENLEGVEAGLSDTAEGLEDVEGGLSDTAEGLEDVEDRISDTSGDLRRVETRLSDTENGLANVEDGLDDLSDSLKGLESGLSSLSSGLKKLESSSGKINDFLSAASDLSGSITALRRALAQALAQAQETADSSAQSAAEFSAKDMLQQVETVGGLFRHAENGPDPDEAAFFQDMLAFQRPDLDADAIGQLSALFAMNKPELIGAQDPEGTLGLLETYQKLYALYAQPDFEAFCAVILASRAQAAGQRPDMEEIQETARLMRRVWDIHESNSGDRAALELILDSMDTVSSNVGGVHEQTNRLLTALAIPANEVLKDTSGFFDRMGRLDSAVKDVLDISQTLRGTGGSLENASKEARDLLNELEETSGNLRGTLSALRQASGSLRGTLDALTDTSGSLRDTMGALVDTSGSLRDTMGALTDTSESLRDTTGALVGTSGSLRDTMGALTDTSGSLRDTLDALRDSSANLRGTLDALVSASASLRETGKRVVSLSGTLRKISATARTGSGTLREASGVAKSALDDTDALRNVLNRYEPTLQETLGTLEALSSTAAGTVRDSNRLITNTESLTRSVGQRLDSGAEQTLSGLSSAVRKAAGSLDATEDLRDAKNTITDLVEDTWDEYTGDTNNLLLMDSGAEAESLTSPSNPAPQSVQVLIRTQEIEKPEETEEAEKTALSTETSSAKAGKGTFLGRLGQMFRDFWHSITGIFH